MPRVTPGLVGTPSVVAPDPVPVEALAFLTWVVVVFALGMGETLFDTVRTLEAAGIEVPGTLLRPAKPVPPPFAPSPPPVEGRPVIRQRVEFCTARDGTGLAYSCVGSGPPLVKTANWLNHLEFEWESPIWKHWIEELSRDRKLVRYDERGNGLSDWKVADLSFEAFVQDLETVVDAAGVERFDLLGISQGCAVSIAYAVRHPERVRSMILYGGYAQGWAARNDPEATHCHSLRTRRRPPAGRSCETSPPG